MPNDGRRGSPAAHLRAVGGGPRPVGGAAEVAARAYAAGVLRAAGYDVAEVAFAFSDAPGRFGTPVAGVWAALTLGAAAAAGAARRPGRALAVLGAGAGALAAAGAWVARYGTRRIAWRRREAVNLVATRGAATDVWLVAHLDSKSQPVPMALRVTGVTGSLAGAAALAGVALAELAVGRALAPSGVWKALGALGVVASLPVAATTVGTASDGALDNASGVAAVLAAAEVLGAEDAAVGVLLTSAEELGLAGAHAWAEAWARAGRAPGVALNCDGVDDRGPLTVLRGGWVGPRVRRALDGVEDVRERRIPPGLLVDAVALAAAGWDAVTVSRGTFATLGRVHSRRDSLERLRGDGVPGAAALLVALGRATVARG